MVVIKPPIDEKIEDELQSLDERYQELKTKVSFLRKKGKDTSTAELLLLDFTPKLRMARVTYEREDVNAISALLKEIDDELKEAESGSEFSHALELIKEAYNYLREGNTKDALGAYSAVISIYKTLPPDLRRTLYKACLDIRNKLEKNG